TDQKGAPLLNATFSTTKGLLRRFYDENEAQLFALTAKDAVAGELETTVFEVKSAKDLFDIRRTSVTADTTGSTLAEAGKLAKLIDRFRTEPEGWYDEVLIAEMIETAKTAGDVVRNPVTLKATAGTLGNFWTSHLGGAYLFREVKYPAAITVGPKETFGPAPVDYVFDLGDRNQIAKFLEVNELVEPIVNLKGTDAGQLIRQKMDFILVDAAAGLGLDMKGATRRDLRAVAGTLGAERLPQEFTGLAALLNWVEAAGPWPRITSTHPAFFYTLRAKQGPDRDLVNMLLAQLAPLDIRQMFICHKELFYRTYAAWPAAKQAYVAEFLANDYLGDKDRVREALFGPDEDVVEQVGPWGAVKKR
ncbi:MAG: hypothetical protein RLZZ528_93, partial [Pseudomonadota bacterium]